MTASPIPPSLFSKILPWLALGVTCTILVTLAVAHTNQERFFYFWDNFAYQRATLESLSALEQPGASWAHHLRVSMQSGFSQLFTVTLAPLMSWLGESREVYIGGIVGFYLLPCAWFCAMIVHKICPVKGWQWLIVFIVTATLPVFWRASLTGYPDIGGIALLLLIALLIFRDTRYHRISTCVVVGIMLALTFLYRRHLVYALIPLMGITSFSALWLNWRESLGHRPAIIGGLVCRLATSAAIALVLIWTIAPDYFAELISTNFRELYLPFTYPVSQAWSMHVNYVGVVYWVCASIGFGWTIYNGGAGRWLAIMSVAYMASSLAIWVFYLRYLSVQYNLHFAIGVSVGCGLFVSQLCSARKPVWAIVLALGSTFLWFERLDFFRVFPVGADRILPLRVAPLQDPNYATIESLIRFLRASTSAPKNNVLVVASSQLINSDMLTVGEGALFGRNNRQMVIMNGSHADTVQPYPLRDMLTADWLVLVKPFQHHLRVEDQGVVLAAYQSLVENTPFTADWREVGESFSFSDGAIATVFERIRPTSLPIAIDTARRVFDTVGIQDAWTGRFMVGLAATGAEYFDFRMIVPAGSDRCHLDFEQLRFRPGQSEVHVFVRVDDNSQSIVGTIDGSARRTLHVSASFSPDPSAPQELSAWNTASVIMSGHDFSFGLPGQTGVLVLSFASEEMVEVGSPWGVFVRNLTLHNQ